MRFQYTQKGAHPRLGKVTLDGYDASGALSGFTVRSTVHGITTVTLDAVVLHGADLDLEGEVLIPAPVAALLTQFGWTPPDGAAVRGGAMRLVRVLAREPDLLSVMEDVDVTTYGDQPRVEIPREMLCSCAADAHDPTCVVHPSA
jgi:hypothetical protein